MTKTTRDRSLMHMWVATGDGSPLGPTAKCSLCGTYWVSALRYYEYNGHMAATEMCPSRDPDRVEIKMPTGQDIVNSIHEMQDEMAPR